MEINREYSKQIANTILAKYSPLLDKHNNTMNIKSDGENLSLYQDDNCVETVNINFDECISVFKNSGGLFKQDNNTHTIDLRYSILEADARKNRHTIYNCAADVTPMFMNQGLLELFCNNGKSCNFVDSLIIWILLNFKRIPNDVTDLFADIDKNVFIHDIPNNLYNTRNQQIILKNEKEHHEFLNYLYSIKDMYLIHNLNPKTSYPNVVSFEQIANRYFKIFGSRARDIFNPCVCKKYGLDVQYDLERDIKKEKIDLVINNIPISSAVATRNAWEAREQKVEIRNAKIDFEKQLKIMTVLPNNAYDIYIWDEKDVDIIKDALNDNWSGEKIVYVGDVL